ncbi:MAG: preprotein translocase subunit SecA [Mycoplasmataceae bacterium]|nr:preprotein translocase subunit SecA [Mycoplasmataceae bacterium]
MIKDSLFFKSAEIRASEASLKIINSLERSIKNLTDDQLKNKTRVFKQRYKRGESLESIRNEAFAVAREATFRVLNKRPFDVQIIGGIILDLGSVAEMKTGEGKTITSIAPIYLNALSDKGVIVSTVNEYLALRDSEEMGEVFQWLGLTVGINKPKADKNEKRKAYACDVTYSIHSELGFDYLRDNMVVDQNEKVQRGLNFGLIDEVDSILIDEAKTPLIISGGETNDSKLYLTASQFVSTLLEVDYDIDHESQSISLNHKGVNKANEFYKVKNIYEIQNSEIVHRIQNALRAQNIMKRDVEYIVLEGKIELVDSFTGRVMEGRSYSDGLQQALQAKEQIEIEPETKTMATITYQNFFRMFKKLSGMTGTAKTEEQEFLDIYNMRVNVVPTNKLIKRIDHPDEVYTSIKNKFEAMITEIEKLRLKGQPILIGTAEVKESEYLHKLLLKHNIPHTILNAKQNKTEAEIISKAGELNSITIATNMAGRGTDIKLGDGVVEVGGLYVFGTNKAESRRIDNQLKGRAGRQGDIGESKFFLSIEDQLIQRFSLQDKWKDIFKNNGKDKIEGKTILNAFSKAQKKIEGFNYDSRKSVLNYDDVIRRQRDLFYQQRDIILTKRDLFSVIKEMIKNTSNQLIYIDGVLQYTGLVNYTKLTNYINETFMGQCDFNFDEEHFKHLTNETIPLFFEKVILELYEKSRNLSIEKSSLEWIQSNERTTIIEALDSQWQYHINIMDKLRSSTNIVQYSQKNPYQVYAEQGSLKFKEMCHEIAFESLVSLLNNINIMPQKQKDIIMVNGNRIEIPKNTPKILRDAIIKNLEQGDMYEEKTIDVKINDPLHKELYGLDHAIGLL